MKPVTLTLRIATRDWDYLTPLLLGEVPSPHLRLAVTRLETLFSDLAGQAEFDAAEISFSRYASMMAGGTAEFVGIPCFIMRGFRHRCIITTEKSPIESLPQLKGKRIGLTGWRDSGNSWTRAALRREGVGVEDAFWFAGRLTEAHPITDRLDGFGRPGRIEAAPGERPMIDLLRAGELDAIFTPFMPQSFFGRDSGLRPLLRDVRAAEEAYYADVGYVPGHHVVGIKTELVRQHPWLPEELSRLIDESQRIWTEKRRKYADTSPWVIEELVLAARALAPDWNGSGFSHNRRMIADFGEALHVQGILPEPIDAEALFPGIAA